MLSCCAAAIGYCIVIKGVSMSPGYGEYLEIAVKEYYTTPPPY